jgi:parvulin-like peptidyl-prolyl isomerase
MRKIIIGSLFVASSLFAGDVLAVVNGEKITKAEINNVLKPQNITYDKLPAQYKKQILDKIITEALLIQKAENSGVTKTKEYKELLNKVKKQVALQVFLDQKLKVSDAEAKAFYEKNKKMFKQPAKVKARHILVKTKAEAEKLINELKNVPQKDLEAKFVELAKKYSTGPSGKNGGELGWFDLKQMVPAFSNQVKNMKPGEITLSPVKTQFGWHIIYVQDKKPAGYIPFSVVKNQIKQQLKKEKFQKYIQKIKSESKIQYK